ncbi:MAG: acyl-CoA reductase [Flavobacteriaceae bacterium]|nr:acyl-CoA reductase [Flavobacteriaceae bacterium]
MSPLKDRIKALSEMGHFFRHISEKDSTYTPLFNAIEQAQTQNGWFQKTACLLALEAWGETLRLERIEKWLLPYGYEEQKNPKTIAVIMAGNIPLVGLHDLITIWIAGHRALVKCASKDTILIPFLIDTFPVFKSLSSISEGKLEGFDAVIATGSNNAARYFDHYFSKYPHIIRKNKNGVAVLNGNETPKELEALGNDILQYYGLGCRNVSKLYVPRNYDFNLIFGGLYPHANIIDHNKYANNYDYNKAVHLMSEYDFLENGFFMLREEKSFASPIATAHYEYYDDIDVLMKQLEEEKDKLQCIVSKLSLPGAFPFGEAQNPALWDYADGTDTLAFLKSL